MNNQATKTMISLAKYWLLEIFAVLALSMFLPVEVSAKTSEKDCSYSEFDHIIALYYRQNKLKEYKISANSVPAPNDSIKKAESAYAVQVKTSGVDMPLIEQMHVETQKEPVMTSQQTTAFYPEGQRPDKVVKAVITAYTSTPDQTDSTPDIAASGKKVYDGMIAANWLPFGTKIKIPALFGDKVFTVDDRMNSRYGYGRLDVWLDTSRAEALKFGVKRVEVHVFMEDKPVTKLTLAK